MHPKTSLLRPWLATCLSCLVAHGTALGATGDSEQSQLGLWIYNLTPGKVILGVFLAGVAFRVLGLLLGYRVMVPHVVAVPPGESQAEPSSTRDVVYEVGMPRYAAGSEGADSLARTPMVTVRRPFLWLAAVFCCLMVAGMGLAFKMHAHFGDPALWGVAGISPLIFTVTWWVARQLWLGRGGRLPPVTAPHMNLAMRLSLLLFVAVMMSKPVESIGEWAVWLYFVVFAIFGFRQVQSGLRRRG